MLKLCIRDAFGYKWEKNPKIQNTRTWDFPVGVVVKNPPANAGDTGSNPGLERSHMPRSD